MSHDPVSKAASSFLLGNLTVCENILSDIFCISEKPLEKATGLHHHMVTPFTTVALGCKQKVLIRPVSSDAALRRSSESGVQQLHLDQS